MQHIQAIGFDLFDTLITVEPPNRYEAHERMLSQLREQGIAVEQDTFQPVYGEVVRQFLTEARRDGKESHNRFWISATLQRLGYDIAPDDSRVAKAVEAYFSAFLDHAVPVPETIELLTLLKGHYRLGLLSNLTHAPAARQILDRLALTSFFDVLLISGELGYRKPHAQVFHRLINQMGVAKEHMVFIGDDVEADINGARQVGLQPIWTRYVQDRRAALTTGTTSSPPAIPDPPVPTITSWKELLTLLNIPQN